LSVHRCGIKVEELLEISMENLLKKHEPKVAEMRFRMLEDHRQSLLATARARRAEILARSRDASLNVLFAEFSKLDKKEGERLMSFNDFLSMLKHLDLITEESAEGMLTKTDAAAFFNKYSGGGLVKAGADFKEGGKAAGVGYLSWEQFTQLERTMRATVGRLSRAPDGGGGTHR